MYHQSALEFQTIEKIGEKIIEKNETDIGLERISIKELEYMPKGVETDVFRSLQYVAGIQTIGDISSKYFVRGSPSNQNLVLLNGSIVYNPFHALGLFSVIDPEMINSIEFYKGGYTAEYGERVSSVMKLVTKDGNKNNFGFRSSTSFLTTKVLVEGPIPDGSFILTGRKNYSNKVLSNFFDNKNAPFNFYDASFKLNYSNPNFIPGAKFIVHGFLSNDEVDNDDIRKEDFSWDNKVFGIKWFQVYDSPLLSELGLSLSSFNGKVEPNFSSTKPKRNEVTDIGLHLDFTYIYDSGDELAAGLSIKSVKTKLELQNVYGAVSDISESGANISLYAKYKLMRFEDFGIDAGTRLNLAGLTKNGNFFFEPRVSTTYNIFPFFKLKGAWGIYQQEVATIFNENEVISLFEPWVILPDYLEPTRSTHYGIGGILNLTDNIELSAEGYYKITKNLPVINDAKKTEDEDDLLSGTGESFGGEFLAKYTTQSFQFNASYSLNWAYVQVGEYIFYPRYDTRHGVNVSVDYHFGDNWVASIVWLFSTGNPFTEINGYYEKLIIQDPHDGWSIFNSYIPYSILRSKNLGRLPEYHRMDVTLSKSFNISFVKFSIAASIINVYDRKNIFYFKRDTGERVNMLPFLPTAVLKVEL